MAKGKTKKGKLSSKEENCQPSSQNSEQKTPTEGKKRTRSQSHGEESPSQPLHSEEKQDPPVAKARKMQGINYRKIIIVNKDEKGNNPFKSHVGDDNNNATPEECVVEPVFASTSNELKGNQRGKFQKGKVKKCDKNLLIDQHELEKFDNQFIDSDGKMHMDDGVDVDVESGGEFHTDMSDNEEGTSSEDEVQTSVDSAAETEVFNEEETEEEKLMKNPAFKRILSRVVDQKLNEKLSTISSPQKAKETPAKGKGKGPGIGLNVIKSPSDTTLYIHLL